MKRLYRSKRDVKIAGVCAGIAESFNIDPTVVRLAAVFIAIVTGLIPAVVTYLIGWVIIPENPAG